MAEFLPRRHWARILNMTAVANQRHRTSRSASGPYDAVVAGAGLVGTTAALTLARSGFRVGLIDRRRPCLTVGELGFDIRSIALSQPSIDLMDVDIPASPIHQMRVWEEYGGSHITFRASEAHVDALAWMVESSRACVALCEECDGTGNVEWIEGSVSGIESGSSVVTLEFPNRSVSARLLIAADGADSRMRKLLGANLVERSDGDAAVATVVRLERPHGSVAYQRFSDTGPLAFLPLADPSCCAVIWSAGRNRAGELSALDDNLFAAALEGACELVLGHITEMDRRFMFPLPQRVVQDFNPEPRVLFVGDAAHTLHPLAGQGVNLGLEDVAGIAGEARREPADLGRPGRWRGFALRRRARAEVMIGLMRAFRDGYAHGGPVGRWIRNSGVRMFDSSPTIKRQLVREAMGIGILAKFA